MPGSDGGFLDCVAVPWGPQDGGNVFHIGFFGTERGEFFRRRVLIVVKGGEEWLAVRSSRSRVDFIMYMCALLFLLLI